MSKPKRKPKAKPILSRADFALVRAGLFVALGISLYLAWNSLQDGSVPGCGPESDCDKVLSSRWGYVWGVPVSVFAVPVYALLLGLTWQRELRWKPIVALSTLIAAAALWFTGMQFFELRAFCKFCMSAHVAGLLAAVTLLRRSPVPARPAFAWGGAGAAAALALVGAQFAYTAPKPLQIQFAGKSADSSDGQSKGSPRFSLFANQFVLDLTAVPVQGDPDAPHKVVKLFDYTCHHCRDLHHHFKPMLAKFSNELAVISLPMPLDASCNYLMKRTSPSHQNACEFARLGLAVFYAEPAKSHEFDEWILKPALPPPLAQARTHAEALVGKERLEKALRDPRLPIQLKQNIDLYATNSQVARNSRMPQLIFEKGTTVGAVRSPEDLESVLKGWLPLGSPAGKPPAGTP